MEVIASISATVSGLGNSYIFSSSKGITLQYIFNVPTVTFAEALSLLTQSSLVTLASTVEVEFITGLLFGSYVNQVVPLSKLY